MTIQTVDSGDSRDTARGKINSNDAELDGRTEGLEGGLEGEIPIKLSGTEGDFAWRNPADEALKGDDGTDGVGVPTAGTTGQLLAKNSNTNYDTEWIDNAVPTAGTTGQVLAKNSNTDYDTEWIDAASGGGSSAAWDPVRVVDDSGVTLTGTTTIDDIALSVGNRVLRAGGSAETRGIYVVAAGSWTRATDADASGDFLQGKMVYVNEGTEHGGQIWALETSGTVTVDTTSLSFIIAPTYATETRWGLARVATQVEVDAGDSGADIEALVNPFTLAGRTATATRTGLVELATDAETQTGTDTARAITPANLSARSATETRSGVAEIATQGEVDTGTDDVRIVSALKAATRYLAKAGGTLTGFLTLHADPSSAMHAVTKQYADGLVTGGASPASETVAGIAEIATQTETNTGTDDTRIVTPLKLANYSGLGGGSGYRTLVTLGSDVANSTTSFADVTGLSFSVTSGTIYRFEALIMWESPATTTGSRWSINGPASPTLLTYMAQWTLNSTSSTTNNANAYDTGTASTSVSTLTGNWAFIRGIIQPSASGTVIVRFASEAAASAITAKAGSTLEYW